MLTLISLTSLILSANGVTRFVIDNYTIPDPDDPFGSQSATPYPFPIDVCVNYLVELGAGLSPYYGIYTCNEAGTEVTFTDYGLENSECEEPIASDSSNDHTITRADGGVFNCVGEDNYVAVGAYTISGKSAILDGGRICCGDAAEYTYLGLVTTTFATETCLPIPNSDPARWARAECDGESSGTYLYEDDACTQAEEEGTDETAADADYCAFFADLGIATVYRRQSFCVNNGTMELPAATVCAAITDPPTTEPTAYPSASPTEATLAPTVDDSKGYMYIVNNINIALLLVIIAIFVN